MRKKHITNKRQLTIILITLILTIAILAVVIVQLIYSFNASMKKENERFLSDNSNYISENMISIVDQTRKSLEMTALVISSSIHIDNQYKLMHEISKKYDLDYVGYAEKNGHMICTDSFEEKNVLKESYFKDALNGKSNITYVDRKIMFDKVISGLLFTIPVYSEAESEFNGVLVGMLNLKHLASILDSKNYSGQGITYVVNDNGDIVLNTNNLEYSNFFSALQSAKFTDGSSYEDLFSNIQNKVDGFATYTFFNSNRYVHHHSLGIDDWTIVNIVEKDVITANTTKLINQLTAVGVIIMLIIPILLVWGVISFRMSSVHKQVAEAKSTFLANMSHEIRTPLNAIVGISEILMRENLSGVQLNYLNSIISAGNGLLAIINDVLDTSKMGAGKFALVNEKYKMETLLCDIIAIIAIKIGEKPIEFLVDVDVDLPKYVEGDMIRVKQILLNIIGNAVKFTKSGFIKMGIHVSQLNEKEIQLTIPIVDSGIGIEKKDLEDLFISFNQVDTKKNHTIEGTGLGLAISKNLAELMDGSISVESDYGFGSTFTVKIKQTIVASEKVVSTCCFAKLKILLLETSPILIEHYTSIFKEIKINYEIASSASEFTDKISSGEFTHAVANSETISNMEKAEFACGGCVLIALLKLNEQALMDSFDYVIYSPLFIFHLVSILTNNENLIMLAKKSSIDILAIEPMPLVKILVVDDNVVNLQVAKGLMAPYKMMVDCAISGEQAIELIQFGNYDLVFMDQMMPNMNGMQALNQIRELPDPSCSNVPVVALTANSYCDESELHEGVRFNDFLTKPIETIYLNKILVNYLKELNATRLEQKEVLENQAREFADDSFCEQSSSNKNSILRKIISVKKIKEDIETFGGIEGYSEILFAYSTLLKQKITEIPLLVDTNLNLFVIEVHGIKGVSLSLSTDKVSKLAINLEKLGEEKNVDQIKEMLPEFIDELNNTTKIIDEFLE